MKKTLQLIIIALIFLGNTCSNEINNDVVNYDTIESDSSVIYTVSKVNTVTFNKCVKLKTNEVLLFPEGIFIKGEVWNIMYGVSLYFTVTNENIINVTEHNNIDKESKSEILTIVVTDSGAGVKNGSSVTIEVCYNIEYE